MENKCECGHAERLATLEERTSNVEFDLKVSRDIAQQLATLEERTRTHGTNLRDHSQQIRELERSIYQNETSTSNQDEQLESVDYELRDSARRLEVKEGQIATLQAESKTYVTYKQMLAALITAVGIVAATITGTAIVITRLVDSGGG